MNVMEEYLKIIRKHTSQCVKLIFQNKFHKRISDEYLETYIKIRYCNMDEKYIPSKIGSIEAMNDKKLELIEEYPKKIKQIEDIFSCYEYIVKMNYWTSEEMILKEIEKLLLWRGNTLEKNEEITKKELYNIKNETEKGVQKLLEKLESKDFYIKLSKYMNNQYNVYRVNLKYNFKFPMIYSNLAIEKAFHTGNTNEDRLFVEYYLTAVQVLNDIQKGNFRKKICCRIYSYNIKKRTKNRKTIKHYKSCNHARKNNYEDKI